MAVKRPNFLFILTDQQRHDALGISGNKHMHTPNLDKLAKNGIRFTNCYAAQAVCSPSRASIFSGQFPSTHKVDHNIYGIDDTTSSDAYNLRVLWPGLMQDAGYYTGYIGKWHLGEKAPKCFDEWYGWNSLLPHWMGEPHKSQYRVEMEADQAIDFFQRNRNKEFALCLSHYPPHTPYTAPHKFTDLYKDTPLEPKEYYGAVSTIDHHLGRVFAKMHELGLMENTFIIFTSDHGDHFGARPGNGHKRTAHDESARVPLIMYGPRFARCKQVRDELVSNVDFMPTFLEMAGIDAPLGLHGTSLVPLLSGDTPAWRSAVCIQNRLGKDGQKENVTSRGVRTRDWKLILRDSIPERGEHLRELYSHINDPLEHNTIYGRQNAETISSLLLEMDYWARQIEDKKAINLSAECARDLELA